MTFFPTAGLRTVYDVDFTSLSTQDLTSGGDGNKTIDGKTWVAIGTGLATTMAVTNGTGIEFLSSSSGDIQVEIDTIEAASSWSPHKTWRLWLRYANFGPDSNFENAFMGRMTNGSDSVGFLRGYNSTLSSGPPDQRPRWFVSRGPLASVEVSMPAAYSGHNLFVVENTGGIIRGLSGVASGGVGVLPADTTGMIEIYRFNPMESTTLNPDGSIFDTPFVDGATTIRIGISNSVAANSVTYEAMRVEVQE